MDVHPRLQLIESALSQQPDAVVASTIRLWQQCTPELVSIIGVGGFQPLYERSMRMAALQYPWLLHDSRMTPSQLPFDSLGFLPLRGKLEAQDTAQARLASMALFTVFFDMLASLIGEALTTHLLHGAWRQEISALPEKDFRQ